MAHITQEEKKEIAARLKPLLKEFGIKATLSISNHMKLVLKIKSGPIDFIGQYQKSFNPMEFKRRVGENVPLPKNDHFSITHNPANFSDRLEKSTVGFLVKVWDLMNLKNYDNSDVQTDYHEVGFYSEIVIEEYKLI
jgi:hypothetical protein